MLDSKLLYQKCPQCNILLKIRIGIWVRSSTEISKEEEVALRLAGQYVDAVCFNCTMSAGIERNKAWLRKNRFVGMVDVK
jgi:hypothetical protein